MGLRRRMALARVGAVSIGIDISGIAATWLLALTTVLLSRRIHPEWDATRVFLFTLVALVSVAVSVAIREVLFAAAARAMGTRVSGITFFAWGGGARVEREPTTPTAAGLLALTGPVFHLVAGGLALTFARLAIPIPIVPLPELVNETIASTGPVWAIVAFVGASNFAFGAIQSLPALPLDGGRLLRAVLWHFTSDEAAATRVASGVARAIGWTMVALGAILLVGHPNVRAFGGDDVAARILAGAWTGVIGGFVVASHGMRLARWRTMRHRVDR